MLLLLPFLDATTDAIRVRLLTAELVAMAKHNSGAPVEDKPREREVIFRAIRQGVKMGVDPEVTLKVFNAQIEASKVVQREFLAKWKGQPPFLKAPDLSKDIRPMLDALTPVILQGLKSRRYRKAADFGTFKGAPIYEKAWSIAIKPLVKP